MTPVEPTLPAQNPHRRRWLGATAVLLVLAAGFALGELFGWPFLAAPLQRMLSNALDRDVRISADTVAPAPEASTSHPSAFRVRFLGGLHMYAPQIEIAAPAWSTAPHLLLARDVAIDLRYVDLWRAQRGQPLRIKHLQAAMLDAYLERQADGRASWQFGPNPTPTPVATPLVIPLFDHLQVASGLLRYHDVPLALDIEARLSLAARAPKSAVSSADVTADQAASVLTMNATGHYRKLPLKVELVASDVLPVTSDALLAGEIPLTLNATVGRASLVFQGRAVDALHLGDFNGHFSLQGPSLAAVGDPVGVTLPTTAAFRTDGTVVRQGSTWRVVIDDATIGASRLNGAFTYEKAGRVPVLSGRLGGNRLLLADLGPVVGTTPALAISAVAPDSTSTSLATQSGAAPLTNLNQGKGKVLPDRPFDLAALRVMDADVLIDIRELNLNTSRLEPLRPLRAHLQLTGGVLTLSDIDTRVAEGQLKGSLALDGRGTKALWRADLRWDGVRLERWIHQAGSANSPPMVTGQLNGQATLTGRGRSTARILATLQGRARTELRDGTVSHFIVEVAGLDIAQGLGVLIEGDDALPVQCGVADLVAKDGVFRPRVMVLDTTDTAIWIDGSLSLANETLDLRAVAMPKDFSPLTLRSPLRVSGSFADPEVSLEKGPMGLKLASAFLLALVNPLAALIPLIDPGNADEAQRGAAGCQALTLQQRSAAKAATGLPTR